MFIGLLLICLLENNIDENGYFQTNISGQVFENL